MDNSLLLTATKEFTWDCAHMLDGHEGLCKNLHGHTYKLLVTVARIHDEVEPEGPAAGMVVDFKELKEIVKELIVDPMDHALVIYDDSNDRFEQELYQLASKFGKKMMILEYRPTAELMVSDFYTKLQNTLEKVGAPIAVVKMRLYETPTSYAEISL